MSMIQDPVCVLRTLSEPKADAGPAFCLKSQHANGCGHGFQYLDARHNLGFYGDYKPIAITVVLSFEVPICHKYFPGPNCITKVMKNGGS